MNISELLSPELHRVSGFDYTNFAIQSSSVETATPISRLRAITTSRKCLRFSNILKFALPSNFLRLRIHCRIKVKLSTRKLLHKYRLPFVQLYLLRERKRRLKCRSWRHYCIIQKLSGKADPRKRGKLLFFEENFSGAFSSERL